MAEVKFTKACDVCDQTFQYGPHRYELRINNTYRIYVCDICHEGNWDGWNLRFESKVIKNLIAAGDPIPARLPNGLLPRE